GAVFVVEVDGVHQLAINVELQVAGSRIPDADRLRAEIPVEVIEGLLTKVVTAVDAVHDVERAGVVLLFFGARLHEEGEGARLLRVAEAYQGIDGEGRVARPGIAVIPMAHAADLFREAGSGGGDDGAGGEEGQEFENERRTGHHLPPAAVVAAGPGPSP